MAKKLTVDEAIQRVIDKVNLTKDPESADLQKYMREYSSLRNLGEDDFEKAYMEISERLFGCDKDQFQRTFEEVHEELFEQAAGGTEEEEKEGTENEAVAEAEIVEDDPGTALVLLEVLEEEPTAVESLPSSLMNITVTGDDMKELGKSIIAGAKAVGKVALNIGFNVSLGLMDVWYWLTTYIPIGLRWLFLRMVWDILPAAKEGWTAGLPVVKEVAGAMALTTIGMAVTVIQVTVEATVKTCRMLADGWEFRKEILKEMAA